MSDCACVYVEGDNDGGTCFNPTYHKARKPRVCDECGNEIQKSERYERAAGTDGDGGIWRNDTCPDCLSMRDSFFCRSWAYGMLWEDLQYHIEDKEGEISSSCIVSLTPIARVKVCEIIEGAWALAEKRETRRAESKKQWWEGRV